MQTLSPMISFPGVYQQCVPSRRDKGSHSLYPSCDFREWIGGMHLRKEPEALGWTTLFATSSPGDLATRIHSLFSKVLITRCVWQAVGAGRRRGSWGSVGLTEPGISLLSH